MIKRFALPGSGHIWVSKQRRSDAWPCDREGCHKVSVSSSIVYYASARWRLSVRSSVEQTNQEEGVMKKFATSKPESAYKRGRPKSGASGMLSSVLGLFGIGSTTDWSSVDHRLVMRLKAILAEGDGPIDSRKAPVALPKLKRVLTKRITITDAPPSAPSVVEVRELYLELARFYPQWDDVGCDSAFSRRYASADDAARGLINCISRESAEKHIARMKQELLMELNEASL